MSMLMYKGQIVATNANTYSDLLGKPLINDSELGVVNNAESLQLTWYGSQDEYDAIPVKNEYTLYIVLDGSEGEGSGGSANYNSLINKPAIEGITLYSNTTYDDLDLMTRTEIESKLVGVYTYRGKVETIDDLPALAEIGDIYFVEETQSSYAWNGATWDDLGSGIDLSKYQTIEDPLLMTDDITVPGAINEHELQIGELEDLKTEDKTNLVAAINELIGYETKMYIVGVTGDVDDYVSETYGVTTGMTAIDAYNAATGAAASMDVSTFAFRFFAAGISDAPNADGYIFIESSDVDKKKIRAFDNNGREWYYDFGLSDWVEIVEEIDYRFPIYVFNAESEDSLIEKYGFSTLDNADNFFANAEANKVKEYCGEVGFVIPGSRVADIPTTDATALVYIKTIGDTTDKITCVADDGKWYKIPGEDWVLIEDNYDAPRYIYDAADAKLIAFLQRKNFKLDSSESSIDLYNTLVANFPYPVDVIVPNTLVNDLPTLDPGVSPVGKISICNHKDNTNLIVYSLNNEDNEYLEYYRAYDVATSTWGDWVERVYYDKAAIPTYKVVATDDDADKAVKKRLDSASILGMDVKDIYGLTIGKKFISIEVPATAVTGIPDDLTDDIVRAGDLVFVDNHRDEHSRIMYKSEDDRQWYMSIADDGTATGEWTEIVIEVVPQIYRFDITSTTDEDYLWLNDKYSFEYSGLSVDDVYALVAAIDDREVEIAVAPADMTGVYFTNILPGDRVIFRNFGAENITYKRDSYGEIFKKVGADWTGIIPDVFDINGIAAEAIYEVPAATTPVDIYAGLVAKVLPFRPFKLTCKPDAFTDATAPYEDRDDNDSVVFQSWGAIDERITYKANNGKEWYMEVDLDTNVASGVWTRKETVLPEIHRFDIVAGSAAYNYFLDNYDFDFIGGGKSASDIVDFIEDLDKKVQVEIDATIYGADNSTPYSGNEHAGDRVIFRNFGDARITYKRVSADAIFDYGELFAYDIATDKWVTNEHDILETTIEKLKDMYLVDADSTVGLYNELRDKVLPYRGYNIVVDADKLSGGDLPETDIDGDKITIKSWGRTDERITYADIDGKNYYMAVDTDTNTASGIWTEIVIDKVPEVFTIDVTSTADAGYLYLNEKYNFEYEGKTIAEIDAFVQAITDKDVEVCVVPTAVPGIPFAAKTTDRIIFRNYGIDRITYYRANYGEIVRYDLATSSWMSNKTELFELDITDIDKSAIVDEYDAATGINTVVGLYDALKSKVGIYRPFDVLAAPSAFDAAALPYTEDVNANDRIEIKSTGNHDERITYTAINGRFWYMDVDLDTLAASGVWTEVVVEVKPVIEEYDGRDDTGEAFAYVFEKLGYTTAPAAGSLKYIDFYNELKACDAFKNGVRFLINASYFEDKPEQSKTNSYIVFDTSETDTYKSIIFVSNDYSNSITLYAEYKYNSFRHNWVYGTGDKEVKIYRIYYPSDVAAVEFENKYFKIYLRTIKDVYNDLMNVSNDSRIALEYNWSDYPAGTATDKPTVANTYKAFSDERVDSLPAHDMNDVIYMSNVESDLLPEISRKTVGIVYKFKDGTTCRRVFDNYTPTDDWRLVEAAPEFVDPIIKEYDTIDNPEATAYIFDKLGYDASTVKSCADIWTDITTDDELKYGTRIIISGKYISDDAGFAIADDDRVVFNTTVGANEGAIVCYRAATNKEYYELFTTGGTKEPSGSWLPRGIANDVKYYRIYNTTDKGYIDLKERYVDVYNKDIGMAYYYSNMVPNPLLIEYNYAANATDYPTAATTYRGLAGLEDTRVDSLPAPSTSDVIMIRNFKSENISGIDEADKAVIYTFADGTKCYRIISGMIPSDDWRLIEERPVEVHPVIEEYDTINNAEAKTYVYDKLGYTDSTTGLAFTDVWDAIMAVPEFTKGCRIIFKQSMFTNLPTPGLMTATDTVTFDTTTRGYKCVSLCVNYQGNLPIMYAERNSDGTGFTGKWIVEPDGGIYRYHFLEKSGKDYYTARMILNKSIYGRKMGTIITRGITIEEMYAILKSSAQKFCITMGVISDVAAPTDRAIASNTYKADGSALVDSLPALSGKDLIVVRNYDVVGTDEADPAQRITYKFVDGTICYGIIGDDGEFTGTWKLAPEAPATDETPCRKIFDLDVNAQKTYVFSKLGISGTSFTSNALFEAAYDKEFKDIIVGGVKWLSDAPAMTITGIEGMFTLDLKATKVFDLNYHAIGSEFVKIHVDTEDDSDITDWIYGDGTSNYHMIDGFTDKGLLELKALTGFNPDSTTLTVGQAWNLFYGNKYLKQGSLIKIPFWNLNVENEGSWLNSRVEFTVDSRPGAYNNAVIGYGNIDKQPVVKYANIHYNTKEFSGWITRFTPIDITNKVTLTIPYGQVSPGTAGITIPPSVENVNKKFVLINEKTIYIELSFDLNKLVTSKQSFLSNNDITFYGITINGKDLFGRGTNEYRRCHSVYLRERIDVNASSISSSSTKQIQYWKGSQAPYTISTLDYRTYGGLFWVETMNNNSNADKNVNALVGGRQVGKTASATNLSATSLGNSIAGPVVTFCGYAILNENDLGL